MALGVDSRQQAPQAGCQGTSPATKAFMYGRSFQDLDGHLWEVLYMDPAALPEQA